MKVVTDDCLTKRASQSTVPSSVSEFAFSRAFSRVRGQPPGRYRSVVRADASIIRSTVRTATTRG